MISRPLFLCDFHMEEGAIFMLEKGGEHYVRNQIKKRRH